MIKFKAQNNYLHGRIHRKKNQKDVYQTINHSHQTRGCYFLLMFFFCISQNFTEEYKVPCIVNHINVIGEMECLNLVLKQHFPLCMHICVLISSFLLLHANKLKKTTLKFDLSYRRLLRVNAMKTPRFTTSPCVRGMNSL